MLSGLQSMLSDKLLGAITEIQPYLHRITHIEAAANYCNIHYEDNSPPKMLRITLSSLDLYFPNRLLLKVHKSYLINPKRIVGVRKRPSKKYIQYEILLDRKRDPVKVPIGGHFLTAVEENFPEFFKI